MFYRINKEDGYILGVVKGVSIENANCSEKEYINIRSCLENMPKAPDGYCYRLNENLEWVLCEIPIVEYEGTEPETATETDYQTALESLGVNFNA